MTPERTKEEILNEAAKKHVEEIYGKGEYNVHYDRPAKLRYESFKAGAKWQESQPVESKWVSVKERLPEAGVDVLTRGGIAYVNRDGTWYTITGCEYPGRVIQWEVTHWQPLPELPSPTNNQ